MKNLILALLCFAALLFAAPPAQSQSILTPSIDTLSNGTTGYLAATVATAVDLLTFQLVLTKIDGTVAGTAIPQASIDGTNYVDISTDTFTLANQATNTKIWTFLKAPYKHYRIKVVTTGTQRSIQSGKIYSKQPPKS